MLLKGEFDKISDFFLLRCRSVQQSAFTLRRSLNFIVNRRKKASIPSNFVDRINCNRSVHVTKAYFHSDSHLWSKTFLLRLGLALLLLSISCLYNPNCSRPRNSIPFFQAAMLKEREDLRVILGVRTLVRSRRTLKREQNAKLSWMEKELRASLGEKKTRNKHVQDFWVSEARQSKAGQAMAREPRIEW